MTSDSEPIAPSNLVELVRARARRTPGRRAYVFLADGERETADLTWTGLDVRAVNPDIIRAQRHDLDQREHQLITAARDAGATWQQIAARLGYKDRQAAQQRHHALARALARRSP